jgi:translation initiation factor 2B subunit (eIF-2B alpha/beta/delta family)
MGKKIDDDLAKIISDKTSGSAELLLQLNSYFKKYFLDINNPPIFIQQLKKHFLSFRNIQVYLNKISTLIANNKLSIDFFSSVEKNINSIYDKIFANTLPLLKDENNILTISNSKSVFEILRRLHQVNKRTKVIITESRPNNEGRILAKKLLDEKIKVEFITESMMAKYVACCDCALIGADTVLKNKNVVNKIGGLQLAILCQYYEKPFYVVTSKSKFSSKNIFKQNVERDTEIWKNAPAKIIISNFYFEIIPKKLVTKIFTE